MQAVERLSSYITQGVYTVSGPFHPFGGAVDIIVVEQQDGSFKSSPWYVRFGKFLGVLKTREMVVKIFVNGMEASFHMCLDNKGEAFFLRECDSEGDEGEDDEDPSPLSSGDDTDGGGGSARSRKSNRVESCETESISKIDVENGKIVGRTESRRSRIFGLVFGRRTPPAKEDDEAMPRLSSLERAEMAADLLETKWSTNLPVSLGISSSQSEAVGKEEGSAASSSGDSISMAVDVHEEHFGESKVEFSPSFRTHGEVVEVYKSDNGDLINRHEIFSDIPPEMDIPQIEAAAKFGDSTVITERIVDFQSSEFALLSNNSGGILSEEPGGSLATGDFTEERRGRENASYIFYETIQSSTVRIDVADNMGSSNRVQEAEHNTGNIRRESIGQISTLAVLPEQEGVSEQASHPQNLHVHIESPTVRELNNRVLFTASDTLQREMAEEELACEKLEDSEPVILENSLEPDEASRNVNPDVGEEESVDVLVAADSPDAGSENQEAGPSVRGLETDVFHPSDKLGATIGCGLQETCNQDETVTPRSQLLSMSEDEHAIFSDVNNHASGEVSLQFPIEEEAGSEEHLFLEPEENVLEQELYTVDERFPEGLQDDLVIPTTPIKIPVRSNVVDESDRLSRSLPNVPSQIHYLDMSDTNHPLSSSVQLSPQKFAICASGDGSPSSATLQQGFPCEQVQAESTSVSVTEHCTHPSCTFMKKEKPTIEISLCKHMLFEGMGVEAAAKAFDSEKVDLEKFLSLGPSIVKNNKLIVRIDGRYFPWNVAAPIILGVVAFDKDQIFDSESIRVEKSPSNSGGPWGIWPFRFTKSISMKSEQNTVDENQENKATNAMTDAPSAVNDEQKPRRSKRKAHFITPSPEQLVSLNLKEGRNSVTFSFESAMLGKQQVDARIYLWKWNARIVVSDVDGTITKSDVLGQFMPLVGKDWSQTGVAHLFSSIKDNGYEFIFLSARAIAQAYLTRNFLFNLKQDGKSLPDGPVVISPDGLFPSLYREVIRRAPHEFKIACLEEIRALFPPECNPFYAGFGNRHTDEISYLKVGIPKGKIFTINPRGQVAVNHLVDTRSYTSLHSLVNGMFPPTTAVEQEEFNNWNFWRLPVPDVDG